MNFLTSLQADRLISQIREESDPTSPAAKKAFDKLGRLGNGAVPKILEALASADKRQTVEYVELLGNLINDKTLPIIARGLADSDPRTVSGTAWALASNRRYNVNRLVDLLGEDDFSKAAIIEILTAHKDRLNVRQLLGQIYYLQPSEKAAIFKRGSGDAPRGEAPRHSTGGVLRRPKEFARHVWARHLGGRADPGDRAVGPGA
jgi:serine/threonine-protein kinase